MEQDRKPNVVLILADDLGFSDIGCYGGDIETPNLDRLAANGVRLTNFSNTARCSPARASLLTGLHPHQAGMAHLEGYYGPYTEKLSDRCVTIAEVLKRSGYGTYMSGKWHVGSVLAHQRGFDMAAEYKADYYRTDNVTCNGEPIGAESFGVDYYSTDHMTLQAISFVQEHVERTPEQPFFLYMPYTAPHFPLQAKPDDIAKYKGRFDLGWDELRAERFSRMREMGLIDADCELSPKEGSAAGNWEEEPHKEWRLRAMEVYAAMVDCMDRNIGKLLELLERNGQLDNTIVMFLADNGGNGEFPVIKDTSLLPGGPDFKVGYGHYGYGWANLSNTPFRMYKHYIHEGGIASPFIFHWPTGLQERGTIRHSPAQLTDVMATIVEYTGAEYPKEYNGHRIMPMEGTSIRSILEADEPHKEYLFWEHEGNCGIRCHNWKLVKFYQEDWELYNLEKDGTELHDLAEARPDLVSALEQEYAKWAERTSVLPREEYVKWDKVQNRKMQVADIQKVKEWHAGFKKSLNS